MASDHGFEGAIDASATTLADFVRGDATSFAALWSQDDDVTIFGGWGAYERGWDAVGPRLTWAADRFADGQVTCEPLAAGSSGDLGYAIGLERGEVRLVGREESSPLLLRVTHIFRREEGRWKLIHRHADPITARTVPEEILQR